jgi:LysM repeat protein
MVRRFGVILLLLLFPKVILAADVTTVTLPLLVLQQGQSGVVEAQIECVADGCSAFDIIIQFAPDVIQVDDVAIGPFLGEQVFTAENLIDNDTGLIHLAATALGDMTATNEPVLLSLDVTALDAGTTQLRIVQLNVGDLIGNPLETASIDGGIVVTAGDGSAAPVQPQAQPTEEEPIVVQPDSAEQPTCQYVLRPGDTLSGIALANRVTVNQIIEINNIADPRAIVVGQTLIIPASDCHVAMTSGTGNITEVFDCRHLGSNIFEWYSVRSVYDASGNAISHTRIGGPFTGEWRPGCPQGERPRPPSSSSRSNHSNEDSGTGDDSGSGEEEISDWCRWNPELC